MEILKKHSGIIFVFLISLLPLINLLTPGLPVTHDSLEHTARIASFYQSLKEGHILPRWSEYLNWGYGHPVMMFLYPLPSYFTSFFHFLGFPLTSSFKIVMAISFSLSGIFMYLWLKKFLGEKAALAGSIIYLFAPYRFIDLYVRGALGEHVAFIFIPLVLLAILSLNKLPAKSELIKYYLNLLFISLSFAGLILSHNAISLIFFPFIFIYSLYLFFENRSTKKLFITLSSLVFGFLFSFFFWFPAFVEGKYTLRDIVTQGAYLDRFVSPKSLIYGAWNYGATNVFTTQIGVISIILTLISIVLFFKLFKKNDKQKYLFLICIIFLFLSIFLMLKQSNFIWLKLTTLQKLQFPWRFLSLSIFSTSVIAAIFISKITPKFQKIFLFLIIFAALIPTIGYWHAKDYKIYSDKYLLEGYIGTTDTGESTPIWSIRFMENKPKNTIEIISGKGNIKKISRNSTQHVYEIHNTETIRIRENTLYFPGWKVYDNNLIQNIEFQDPKNRGVITFYLNPGNHLINVVFENTKIRIIANFVSIFSLLFIIVFSLLFINRNFRNKKI